MQQRWYRTLWTSQYVDCGIKFEDSVRKLASPSLVTSIVTVTVMNILKDSFGKPVYHIISFELIIGRYLLSNAVKRSQFVLTLEAPVAELANTAHKPSTASISPVLGLFLCHDIYVEEIILLHIMLGILLLFQYNGLHPLSRLSPISSRR